MLRGPLNVKDPFVCLELREELAQEAWRGKSQIQIPDVCVRNNL